MTRTPTSASASDDHQRESSPAPSRRRCRSRASFQASMPKKAAMARKSSPAERLCVELDMVGSPRGCLARHARSASNRTVRTAASSQCPGDQAPPTSRGPPGGSVSPGEPCGGILRRLRHIAAAQCRPRRRSGLRNAGDLDDLLVLLELVARELREVLGRLASASRRCRPWSARLTTSGSAIALLTASASLSTISFGVPVRA